MSNANMTEQSNSTPLDYDRLVAEYNRDLFNVLRGHRSLEYLETWVPDTNPFKGLLNMVESVEAFGLTEISIAIGAKTRAALDEGALMEALSAIGQVEFRDEHEKLVIDVRGIGS